MTTKDHAKKSDKKTVSKPAKADSKKSTTKKAETKSKPKAKPAKVEHGHLVSVEYVGTLKSGEEFDNSKHHGPIQFIVGSGQVIKGFDDAVISMKVGDAKKFTIPKHEAYGDSNPSLIQIVPLSKIPEHVKSQIKVGGFLVMQAPTGQQVPVKIMKLDKENVHLDMNHPLAGQDLTFEIKLVGLDHAPEGHDHMHDHGSDDGCCGGDCACSSDVKKKDKDDCCGGGCCH